VPRITYPAPVLYVHSSAQLYGSDGGLLRLVAGLDRERFTPLVVMPEAGPLLDALAQLKVESYVLPLAILHRTLSPMYWARTVLHLPQTVSKLATLLRARQVRLVHSNTSHVLDGGLAARRAGVPHIWHIRELHTGRSRIGRLLSQLIARYSDLILVMSNGCAEAFYPQRPAYPPLRTVYDGIDTTLFHPQVDGSGVRAEWELAPSTPLIGMVARIAHWKGHRLFLEAAAQIHAALPAARFVVVGEAVTPGDQALKGELLALRARLGLEQVVHFAGLRRDMAQVMAALDFFVLPSLQPEPWGFVTLEAMATGKPVVATRQGGPLEMIVEGESGYFVDPLDPADLAARLLALVRAPEAAKAMGLAARRQVEARFSVARSSEETILHYETILGQTEWRTTAGRAP
jgi:glycosyltransferase involved in cell wall biosynthesis